MIKNYVINIHDNYKGEEWVPAWASDLWTVENTYFNLSYVSGDVEDGIQFIKGSILCALGSGMMKNIPDELTISFTINRTYLK